MNGINRRSQKVVCVQQIEVIDQNNTPFSGPYPKLDAVYTVDCFMDSGSVDTNALASGPPYVTLPGVAILEIPPLRCKGGKLLGWPLFIFRPLDERETKETVKELLRVAVDSHGLVPAL